jgi:hypothetical protein
LQLGFEELQVCNAETPVRCRDENRLFVFMPLDQKTAIPSASEKLPDPSPEAAPPVPPTPEERRKAPMPPSQPNGQRPDNGQPAPSPPEQMGLAEVIAEVEALRSLLQDGAVRTGRLLSALKHQRRQSRAVQAAMESLRQFQLDR